MEDAIAWGRARASTVLIRTGDSGCYFSAGEHNPDAQEFPAWPPAGLRLERRRPRGFEALDNTEGDPPVLWDVRITVDLPHPADMGRFGESIRTHPAARGVQVPAPGYHVPSAAFLVEASTRGQAEQIANRVLGQALAPFLAALPTTPAGYVMSGPRGLPTPARGARKGSRGHLLSSAAFRGERASFRPTEGDRQEEGPTAAASRRVWKRAGPDRAPADARTRSLATQLVQSRIRKLHLDLDADRVEYPAVRGPLDQVVQQRRLADAGVASQHERLALACADGAHQQIERRTLPLPARSPGPGSGVAMAASHPNCLNPGPGPRQTSGFHGRDSRARSACLTTQSPKLARSERWIAVGTALCPVGVRAAPRTDPSVHC